MIGVYRMSIQILDNFNRIHFPSNLNLVRLHNLLNSTSYFTQPRVNSSLHQSCVSRVFHSLQQLIIGRIEGHSKRAVDYSTLYLRPEIYLTDIIISDNSVVPRIRSIVSSHVVQRTSCRKRNARLQPLLRSQFPIIVLKLFTDVNKPSAWFDDSLSEPPDLSLNLRCLSEILQLIFDKGLLHFKLLTLDSGHLILMHFVGRVPLKLIVGKFILHRIVPTSQTPKNIVSLSLRKLLCLVIDCRFGFALHSSCVLHSFGRFFLLLVLLFLLLFVVGVGINSLLLLLLLVLGRVSLLLQLFLDLPALNLHSLLLFRQFHLVDLFVYIIA